MKIERKPPENLLPEHLPYFRHHFEMTLPEPGFRYIRGHYALFANGVVVSSCRVQKQSLLYDSRLREIGKRSLLKVTLKSAIRGGLSWRRKAEADVAIINERSNNYFHWFTEALPKLMVILEAGIQPVVLLPRQYSSAYQKKSLALLGVGHETFAGDILIGKGLFLPNRLAPYSAHYNPSVMERLAARLKQSLRWEQKNGKRIYMTRRNADRRKVQNEEQVIRVLEEFGFESMDMDTMDLEQQVALMAETDVLVSIHGAALTNMIFCRQGTRILEFSLEKETMDKCYFNLANAMQLKYYYQFCRPASLPANYFSSDLIVDVGELAKNLENLMENANA